MSKQIASNWQVLFDISSDSCYKIYTSPLFLRGQGARRRIPASAYLSRRNQSAVGKLRQSGITIGSPRSLTKTILDMRAANRTSAKRISTTDFTESEGDDYAG